MNTKQRSNVEELDKLVMAHIREIVEHECALAKLDREVWFNKLYSFVVEAVNFVRPSTMILDDEMDISHYVRIITIEAKGNVSEQQLAQRSSYLRGLVMRRNVADKRMRNRIENPRVLLLGNSLGYVREEEDFTDIASVIKQEEHFVEIIRDKIARVQPSVVVVEKDVSRQVIDRMREDNITVVTNVKPEMLKMIARFTQTLIIPSTHLIDASIELGQCEQFCVEKVSRSLLATPSERDSSMRALVSKDDSLMYFKGTSPWLGCSVLLYGPDKQVLKHVKSSL